MFSIDFLKVSMLLPRLYPVTHVELVKFVYKFVVKFVVVVEVSNSVQ